MSRPLTHLLLAWLLLSLQLATACAVPPTGADAVGVGQAACVEGATAQAHAAHAAHQGADGPLVEPSLAALAPVAAPCAHLTHCLHCAGALPVLAAPAPAPALATAIEPAPWLPVVAPVPAAAPVRRPQRFSSVPEAGSPVPAPPLFLRTARLRL